MRLDIPELGIPRVVIIGGGFGGIQLAKSLQKYKVQVVLLDKNNYHTFQPLLYQVATSGLGVDNIAYPIRKIFKDQPLFHFRMAEVKEIIPENNMLITNINHLYYDYLIVATGSQTNFFKNEGLAINAMPMKTILESLNLRSMVLQNFEKALVISNERKKQSLLNYVIAGGGPTGVELAGALGELKQHVLPKDYPELDIKQMNIYLIQSDQRVLPTFSEKTSAITHRDLEKLGVKVLLKTRVLDYQGDFVQTNNNDEITAHTLIWTAGVVGSTIPGLKQEAYTKNNRFVVDEYNVVSGYKNIYAVGDVAAMISEKLPMGHPMVAQVAMQQGLNVAKNIGLLIQNKNPIPFTYNDKGSMATIGKNKAVVEIGKLRFSGSLGWFMWLFVHLMSLVGYRNRVIVLINWIGNYFTYDRGIRLIITPFELSKAKKMRRENLTHVN